MMMDFKNKTINYIVDDGLYHPLTFKDIYQSINEYIKDNEVVEDRHIEINNDIMIRCIKEKDSSISIYATVF